MASRLAAYGRGTERAIRVRQVDHWRREFPMFHSSKSRFDDRRARRFFETMIVVCAACLALLHHSAARPIALLSLNRNRSRTLAGAMEGDRDTRRQKAIQSARRETRVSDSGRGEIVAERSLRAVVLGRKGNRFAESGTTNAQRYGVSDSKWDRCRAAHRRGASGVSGCNRAGREAASE